jgi:hypothetical protein
MDFVSTRGLGAFGHRAAVFLLIAAAVACRVNKDDLARWKKTVNGPDKLIAVLTHDKYEKDLRVEAAWSLLEMPRRGGQAIGLARLLEELERLPVSERRDILDGVWKRLKPKVEQPINVAGDGKFSDPAVLYKDATFAFYTDDKLDIDAKMRDEMTAALTEWAVGRKEDAAEKRLQSFEVRMENTMQAYGVEQVLRKLGLPAAKQLPSLLTAPSALKSQRLDSMARIVVDVKPSATEKGAQEIYDKARDELSANFAVILKNTLGDGFINAVKGEIDEALKKAPNGKQVLDNPENYKKYMNDVRNERLTGLFAIAKQVGRKPVVDVLMSVAVDEKADPKHRALALAALEGNIDTNNTDSLKSFLAIGRSGAPDEVKHGAMLRITAYPPDQATRAYYELFDNPNWKVRYDGAMRIIDLMHKVGDKTKTTPKEFLAKLPRDEKTKMALGEPSAYGSALAQLQPELKAKEAIDDALRGKPFGAMMTALGWYYAKGTKEDLTGVLEKHEKDKTPVPKCKEDEECGWEKPGCPVPKGSDVEYKPINTVGDYVQFCVKPEIEKRVHAGEKK